ncbi:MAG: hypothetical protein JNK05_33515 [Myxococcales bacterium]|nr:hypothetical protein [Myxococcales bacterium]
MFKSALLSAVSMVTCAALVLSAPDAHATTVVPVTVEQLSSRADVVVVATVRSTRALWEGRLIVTDCELEVRVAMKGSLAPGQTLTLRVPGGVLGDIGQTIPGVPRVERGDTFVAFVTRAEDRAPGRYYLTHLTASILPLSSLAPTAATPSGSVVVRPAAEGMIVEGSTGPTAAQRRPNTLATRTAMPRAGLPLEQLLAVVRGAR